MAGWYYIESSFLSGDDQVGPITGDNLLQLAQDGTLNLDTQIAHEKYTKGQWVPLAKVSAVRKKYEAGLRQREEEELSKQHEAVERRAEKKAEREQIKREKEEEKRRRAAEEAEALANSPFAKFLGDGQDPGVIAKAYNRIVELLTPQEVIEYIAVALHVPGFQSPDCVVATNRRFMVVRQKILGRLDFEDHLWVDLHDARLKEGIMSSEVSFRTTGGQFFKADYLPKVQARKVYSFCQQQEENARENRRQLTLEEKRAAAGNVNVNAAIPAAPVAPQPAPQPAAPPPAEDPVQKLSKLKQMLDAGLIEQSEYDSTADPDDLDWLCDWTSPDWDQLTLTGLEETQEDFRWYMENKTHDEEKDIGTLLVMVRFVQLIRSSLDVGPLQCSVPLLATAHDFDMFGRFLPQHVG